MWGILLGSFVTVVVIWLFWPETRIIQSRKERARKIMERY